MIEKGTVEYRRAYNRVREKAIREGTWVVNKGGRKREGTDLQCAYCQVLFYRPPANIAAHRGYGENNYCSRACMTKAYIGRISPKRGPTKTKPCDSCGTLITRPLWMWRTNALTFCNRTCFGTWKSTNWTAAGNPVWRGGKCYYYGANWQRQQRDARRRDNHHCQFCTKAESQLRRALDVHHIYPFRYFGLTHYREANRLTNLISLCAQCHTYLEKFSDLGTIHDWPTLRARGMTHRQTTALAHADLPELRQGS